MAAKHEMSQTKGLIEAGHVILPSCLIAFSTYPIGSASAIVAAKYAIKCFKLMLYSYSPVLVVV